MTALASQSLGQPLPRPPLPEGPVLVAGLARAGQAAVAALVDRIGPGRVLAWDADMRRSMQRVARRLRARGVRVWIGPEPALASIEINSVIKSPGIAPSQPLLAAALAAGLPVIDELELGWRLLLAPMIAITGTNGKSTTSGLLATTLAAAGMRTAVVGNTAFGPPLSAVAHRALDVAVCEVSSYQLEACDRLLPEIAVLTNLTPEHLGRHRSMDRYGEIKTRLFARDGDVVGRAVVNIDDPLGGRLARLVRASGGTAIGIGADPAADYQLRGVRWGLRHADLAVRTPSGTTVLSSRLPGAHNARNVLTAFAVAELAGVSRADAIAALAGAHAPPGRFEHVDCRQPFAVIVDLSTTPDALEHVLHTVRHGMDPGGRLRVVLGVVGRPGSAIRQIGRIARDRTDHLVLTSAAALSVPPMMLLHELRKGARGSAGAELEIVIDRRRAITRALASARSGDVVLILGRGEMAIEYPDPHGDPFGCSDREMAIAALAQLGWGDGRPARRPPPVGHRDTEIREHRAQPEQLGVGRKGEELILGAHERGAQ